MPFYLSCKSESIQSLGTKRQAYRLQSKRAFQLANQSLPQFLKKVGMPVSTVLLFGVSLFIPRENPACFNSFSIPNKPTGWTFSTRSHKVVGWKVRNWFLLTSTFGRLEEDTRFCMVPSKMEVLWFGVYCIYSHVAGYIRAPAGVQIEVTRSDLHFEDTHACNPKFFWEDTGAGLWPRQFIYYQNLNLDFERKHPWPVRKWK